MIVLTNTVIRRALARRGWAPAPNQLHILAVRGAVPAGQDPALQVVPNTPDAYNDSLILFGTHLQAFRGSVDPGAAAAAHPSNPRGVAHLCNGRWLFGLDYHKGHKALKQAAPVKVWRDRDADHVLDPHELVQCDWFGIDIHAGGTTPSVGRWSEGCLVIAGGWAGAPWQTFLRLCLASQQEVFDTYLIDAADLSAAGA
jgi:hypothetical protein